MLRVSFQGERGAYSEAAALSFFGKKIKTVPLPTFTDIIEHTENGKTDYTILPVENSLEGSVGESHDLLYSTKLYACGETYFRIRHCLIGLGPLDKIDTVYSHPQALGQCRKFIQKHHMKTIACIASKTASEIYGVPVVKDGIEDNSNNYTRFLILSKEKTKETGKDKASIIFSVKHEAGALFRVIEKFHDHKINLTKIESRPTKNTPWEYNFYVDFEGHEKNPKIAEVLKKIRKETLFLKILGSYHSAELD